LTVSFLARTALAGAILAGAILAGAILASASLPAAPSVRASDAARPSSRFSPLTEITPDNVSRLAVAWTAHTGEFAGGQGPAPSKPVEGFQCRPVLVGESLVVTTTTSKVIALDAETGAERWRHDPFAGRGRVCDRPHRGVAVWDGTGEAERTLFSGTCDGKLVALDPKTGALRRGFAAGGVLDLRPGVEAREDEAYGVTSPPALYRDLVIVGALAPEGVPRGPAGDVRAFDARSGRLVWTFHTVPRPAELGHDTWPEDGWQRRTGVNAWAEMSVDEERGLVFLPLGSASYDFYGGDRKGANLFSSSLVALDARSGERRWHFQLVHHDLWDYDPPAQPILVDIRRGEQIVPAVVQLTKMGLVFVFDRRTGEPVFGVDERAVPQSTIKGEASWPTQPFPRKPAPLARTQAITRADLTSVTPESQKECAAMFDRLGSGGLYFPSGREPAVSFPGTMGGFTWSGGAVDPARGVLFANTNEVGAVHRVADAEPGSALPYRRESPWGEYARFWDSSRLPCQRPPWGQLHALDLATGELVWQVPLGNAPQLAERGITGTGTPNLGGAIATASGLVFIAASNDSRIRAFDASKGRVLWEAPLPASGHATPLTYRGPASGRQFLVIAAGGGGRFSTTVSDAVVAFTLRQQRESSSEATQ
jgi:quinoprotein glucose dehydrogenase